MNILILTPLFPPDTTPSANYTKELVQRLSNAHAVTVLLYGYLPESVANASIVTVDKRGSKISLVWNCFKALRKNHADILFVNNGPSTELPAFLFSWFYKNPIVLLESDTRAIEQSQHGLYKLIHNLLVSRCETVISFPNKEKYLAPEVLPFSAVSTRTLESIEAWWQTHINTLISYGTK